MEFLRKNKWLLPAAVVLALVCVILALLLGKQENPNPTEATAGQTALSGSTTAASTGDPAVTQPETQPVETLPPATWNTVPDMGASYEQWLAASMYMVVYFQYPDCQVVGIYAASETDIAQKQNSMGAYLHILSGGEDIWLHSAPLAQGRSEKGTVDLHTAQLGYATFDQVEPVDTASMTELTLEDLLGPMEYTMLPGLTVN